ncbi:MAG: hypothetical protein Q9220_004287 [cf. Caloplaca sp. 1 TL-2023]
MPGFKSFLLSCSALIALIQSAACNPLNPSPPKSNLCTLPVISLPASFSSSSSSSSSSSLLLPTTQNLTIDHTTWAISPSLALAITICNWEPSPATILATLSAALAAIGKKSAAQLVEKKFVQRSDNKYNTLYFEIGPGWERKVLTWADVGEVLNTERGLPRFFEETGSWHTIYFGVVHKERGVLGQGSVRRWWQ